jgi:nitrite reductase (NADH) small subunit
MSDWKKSAPSATSRAGRPRGGQRGHGRIAVFRSAADEVFAVLDKCPHKAGPLSQGIVHGDTVTCPLHSWKIQLEDGQVVPPDVGCVKHFATKVDNGEVFLAL